MIHSVISDIRTAARRRPLLLAFMILALAALVVRAFFGVDVTDESYYFTQVIRLLQGDRLFADIWDATQTQGIPLLPFYWLYTKLFGYDGLILFGRLLMLLINLMTGGVLYYALSLTYSKRISAWIALLTVSFAPFSLLTISYNNMQQALSLLSFAMAYIAILQVFPSKCARGMLFASGFVHALGIANYPANVATLPLLLLLLFCGAYLVQKSRRVAFRCLLWYAAGLAVVALGLMLYVLTAVGWQNALFGLNQMLSSPGMAYPTPSFGERIYDIFKHIEDALGKRGLMACAALAGMGLYLVTQAWIARVEKRVGQGASALMASCLICLCGIALATGAFRLRASFLLVMCIAYFTSIVGLRERTRLVLQLGIAVLIGWCSLSMPLYGNGYAYQRYSLALAVLLPIQMMTMSKAHRKSAWNGIVLLAVPSLIITCVIAVFSSGFFSNARHGLFCTGLCTLLFAATAQDAEAQPSDCERWWKYLEKSSRFIRATILPVIVVITALGINFSYVYRDAPVRELRTFVSYGPGKGMLTTETRADMLDQMALDLRAHAVPDGKLLVLENCPYAYGICENMTPFATSTWVASMYSRGGYPWIKDINWTAMFDYMAFRNAVPDVILYYDPVAYANVSDPAYGLHVFIQENYTCVLQRDSYWIYRLNA